MLWNHSKTRLRLLLKGRNQLPSKKIYVNICYFCIFEKEDLQTNFEHAWAIAFSRYKML